jgi:hypothetical protein
MVRRMLVSVKVYQGERSLAFRTALTPVKAETIAGTAPTLLTHA